MARFHIVARASTYVRELDDWDIHERKYVIPARKSVHALNEALARVQQEFPHHKEHEANIVTV